MGDEPTVLRFDGGVMNMLPLGIPDAENLNAVSQFVVSGYPFLPVR